MKTTTAKTPADVRKWIEQNEHHNAAILTKEKRQIETKDDVGAYFLLSGYHARIFIPTEIHKQCFLTPYNAPQDRMYRWDDIEEKAAPDFGKYITTDVNTFELDKEDGISEEPCGIRQGVLVEIGYYQPNGSFGNIDPFYVVQGETGWYAMKVGGTYVVVPDENLFGSTKEHVQAVREEYKLK